jgi:hypothetical protein
MTGDRPLGGWQVEHLQALFPEYLVSCDGGQWTALRGDDEQAEPIVQASGELLQVAVLADIAERVHRNIRDRNGLS